MSGPAVELLSGLVLDDGRQWGEAAESWQLADAEALLDMSPDVPALHWWGRPRGASKTTDGAACAVAALVEQFPPSARGYAFAVDGEQAALIVEAAAGLVARSGLGGLLDVQTRRITNRRTDASLTVLAADAASAYGLRPSWLWVDEFPHWPVGHRALWVAVVSAVPKVVGCRLVVVGSAGDPASWVARVFDQAKASEAWRVSDVPGPCPWIGQAALEEQRRLLLDSQYARLHLNRWLEAEDRLATRSDVEACVTPGRGDLAPEPGRRYVAALDVGLVKDRCVAMVCHAEARPGGLTVVVDRCAVWSGSQRAPVDLSVVEAWLAEACRSYRCALVYDPFQAAHLSQRLRAAGVRAEAFTFSSASVGRLAATLFALIRDHRLDLPDDPELVDELCTVRLRETTPGVVRMDHDADAHDDRAVTLGMAAAHLVERSGAAPARTHTAAGRMI